MPHLMRVSIKKKPCVQSLTTRILTCEVQFTNKYPNSITHLA